MAESRQDLRPTAGIQVQGFWETSRMVEFHGYEIQRDAECSETLAVQKYDGIPAGIETNYGNPI